MARSYWWRGRGRGRGRLKKCRICYWIDVYIFIPVNWLAAASRWANSSSFLFSSASLIFNASSLLLSASCFRLSSLRRSLVSKELWVRTCAQDKRIPLSCSSFVFIFKVSKNQCALRASLPQFSGSMNVRGDPKEFTKFLTLVPWILVASIS